MVGKRSMLTKQELFELFDKLAPFCNEEGLKVIQNKRVEILSDKETEAYEFVKKNPGTKSMLVAIELGIEQMNSIITLRKLMDYGLVKKEDKSYFIKE